jgi:hypothetical protein
VWFRDQYRHPNETRRSIDEVLDWFDGAGVDFLSSIPAADGSPFPNDTRLFEPHPRSTSVGPLGDPNGNAADRRSGWRTFIMIGRKRIISSSTQ